MSSFIRDSKTDILATGADQAASSVTWTTTGLTNPNKQALSVSFTPQMKGPVTATVYLALPSKTVYVDPVATIDGVTARKWMMPGAEYLMEAGAAHSKLQGLVH